MTNEKAVKEIQHWLDGCPYADTKEAFKLAINALKERPQGEWIEGENGSIKCDQCGAEIIYSYFIGNEPDFPKFCCDCGADMRGDS